MTLALEHRTAQRDEAPLDLGRAAGASWRCAPGATTPRRLAAALGACDGRTHLVIDGRAVRAEGRAIGAWIEVMATGAAHVLIFGQGGDALAAGLAARPDGAVVVRCADLADAVHSAARVAERGATVLFRPAGPAPGSAPRDVARFRALVVALGRSLAPVDAA